MYIELDGAAHADTYGLGYSSSSGAADAAHPTRRDSDDLVRSERSFVANAF